MRCWLRSPFSLKERSRNLFSLLSRAVGLLLPPPPPEPVSFRLPNEEEEEDDEDEEDVEEELEPVGLGNLEPPASAVRLLVECRRRKPGAKLELGGVTGVPTAFLSSMLLRLVRDFSVCRGGERGGGGGDSGRERGCWG